jgi:hypothetical protein
MLDELTRIRLLLEVYDVALREIRELSDPALDALEARLEARATAAAYDYYERLRAEATLANPDSWQLRRRSSAQSLWSRRVDSSSAPGG